MRSSRLVGIYLSILLTEEPKKLHDILNVYDHFVVSSGLSDVSEGQQ